MNTIERCPVCEPLSYYGGKTGLEEKELSVMCDFCWEELSDLNSYMAATTGDSGYVDNRSPIVDAQHVEIIRAFIAGSDLPYIVTVDGVNSKIEKLCCVKTMEKELNNGQIKGAK